MGVYGDHAKPGGWNDILLAEHSALQRAEAEVVGDFGAEGELRFGLHFLEAAEEVGNLSYIERAKAIIERAGVLAAKEARFHGREIIGWEE